MAKLRGDPTRTTMIRRKFRRDMRKRFGAVNKAVIELVVDLDVFGLVEAKPFTFNVEMQAWRFQTNPQKTESFRLWLQGQIDQEILTVDGVSGAPWTHTYVNSAYRKGTTRAFIDARGAAAQGKQEFFDGTKEEFLRGAFAQPERLQKVELLATRAFEELRGVTATMSQQLNRHLASGLANGENPREIARRMSKAIKGLTKTRAEVIARTEVIHAHAEGQLDTFKELGVEQLGVLAEWASAGDDRVCARCAAMEGEVFTVQEARGLIPLHPNCRCAWIPSDQTVELKKEKPPETQAPASSWTPVTNVKEGRAQLEKVMSRSRDKADIAVFTFGEELSPAVLDKHMVKTINAIGEDMAHMRDKFPGLQTLIERELPVKEVVLQASKSVEGAEGFYTGHRTRELQVATKPGQSGVLTNPATTGKWHTENSVTSTFRHELGHGIEEASMTEALGEEWWALHQKHPRAWWHKEVSEYGSTDSSEAFAEAFSHYTSPRRTGKLHPDIEGFMDRLLLEGS